MRTDRCASPPPCRDRRAGSSRLARVAWCALLLAWLLWLLRSVLRFCRVRTRDRDCDRTNVPPWAVRKPDPMIYSQTFLQSQGLAVTWDNPDIHVERASNPGVPVDSHALAPDTDHVVVARVWNGSAHAPVVELPVELAYLEFGINTVRHDVAVTTVDLAVKGAVGCPAFARIPWRTPPTPGHYCLQVELVWADDEEPGNNMGQHNTDVKPLNSPHARFTFPLRNDHERARRVRLEADRYRIPPPLPCDEQDRDGSLQRHRSESWQIPDDWQVVVEPQQLELGGFETREVAVDVTAPDGFVGREVINVAAYEGTSLMGGVSLYVEGSG